MCILCDNWDATPYSKRPTTDISTNTGHELMLLGFYLGAMETGKEVVNPLCAEHETIMRSISDFKDRQAAAAAAQASVSPPQEAINIQQGYKDRIAKLNAPPAPPPKPIPQAFTALGLGGVTTPQVGTDTGPVIQPIPPAAGVDPEFRFECPNCKQMVTNGQIHDCKYVP